MDDKAYRDGVDITPQDIFDFVAKTKILPKTSAPSIGEYEEFFEKELADLRKKLECAVDAYKREQEMADKVDFYRLKLPGEDLREIGYLIQATLNLRNPEAINKVIWKVYYEKPCTAMIGRVVGAKVVTGIYKITNLQNQMTYVG
mgnify:CR=1 FL=1